MERFECSLREIKAVKADSGEMTFSGYGAVFGNVDWYGDVIKAGAFSETLKEAKETGQWPPMLLQHGGWGMSAEDMNPVGIWTELKEDSVGLFVEGKLAETERGKELYQLMKMEPRPAINGMSIGYIPQEWENRAKPEEPRRTLKKVALVEISLVTFPANSSARVNDVKSNLTIREAEHALREAGATQSQAKAILSHGFKTVPQRDVGVDAEFAEIIRRNIAILKN